MRKLILTADDYGLHENVNQAILEAVRTRMVTSVHVMVNLATDAQIIELHETILASGNHCGIGLHFCTTTGPSVLQDSNSTLTTITNNGVYHFPEMKDWDVNQTDSQDVKAELNAQFNKLAEIIGVDSIDCISSHQNIHFYNSFYSKFIEELSKLHRIPIRSMIRWSKDKRTKTYWLGKNPMPIFWTAIETLDNCNSLHTKKLLLEALDGASLRESWKTIKYNSLAGGITNSTSDHWFGQPSQLAIEWTIEKLVENKMEIDDYSTEVFMHLSNSAEEVISGISYSMEKRFDEFEVVTNPEFILYVQSLYNRTDIQIGSYRKVLS